MVFQRHLVAAWISAVVLVLAMSTTSVQANEFARAVANAKKFKSFAADWTNLNQVLASFNNRRAKIPVALRDINWDGTGGFIGGNGTGVLPGDLFLNGGGFRQIVNDPPLTASNNSFAHIFNKSIGAIAFSPLINVAPINTNKIVISFTLADRKTAGLINGFGAVFNDVEHHRKSKIEFYDQFGQLLTRIWVPASGNGRHSFVGAIFENTVVASVHLFFGDNGQVPYTDNRWKREGHNLDFVACDDWFFYLSDTEVPVTYFRDEVKDINAKVIKAFDQRRTAIILSKPTNINWDGTAGISQGGTAPLGNKFFLNGGGFRQIQLFITGEQGFITEDGFAANAGIVAFSPNVTFGPKNGNTLTLKFFLADRVTEALVHGFGAIFTDVEIPNLTNMRFLDKNGLEIARNFARPRAGNGSHQFVGVLFNRPVVASVVLTLGTNNLIGIASENATTDFVAVDDWFFFLSNTPK